MTDPRVTSREKMIAQLERCAKGQARAGEIIPPDVPHWDDPSVHGTAECIPEEPMGNQAPLPPDTSVNWIGMTDPGEWT